MPHKTDELCDVAERVFLVAGAAGGLGRSLVRALRDRGAHLALLDNNTAGLRDICAEVPDALPIAADLKDEAATKAAVVQTEQHFGEVNGSVNAVGVLPIASADELDLAIFRECIDVNLTAAFIFSRAVAAPLRRAGGGPILHIASVSSHVANPGYSAYASSKAGLAQLVRVLAREWADDCISVNAIGPALTETALTEQYLSNPDFRRNALASIPAGRFGTPEDLVAPALMLLSPSAAFITGQTLYVDGGRTLV
jgi:NAD(P)-dependent dehydrogenase (short-subunit alcohol dehydrogenase family)